MNGYPKYQVSNWGRIKSKERYTNVGIKNQKTVLRKEKILKPINLNKGYLGTGIYDEKNKYHMLKIHRLVAQAFIPNPNNLSQVNHIDGDKTNNKKENLEWCDCKYNMEHSYKIGLRDREKIKENMRILGKSKKGLEARWRK